ALPEPPQLQAPTLLEVGAAANARQNLNVTVAATGDVLTAAAATAGIGDNRMAGSKKSLWEPRHLPVGFPVPVLELSPAAVPEGTEVTVTCRAGVAEPPAVRLQLRDADGGVLAEGPQSPLELRLVARREDDGQRFGCRASLAIGDDVVTKERDARLAVLYMPEMSASDCPGNRTWLRGTREALSCRATGNPQPTVVCGRNGVTVGTGEAQLVTRSRAGTYLCNATNALGTRSRLVTVRVECEWCHRLPPRPPRRAHPD
uniref:Ig-like domain-containing protein n=1 Tax=Calidris pygmaea TaxID=425635 RepID=A0A8C3J619_9CHAR